MAGDATLRGLCPAPFFEESKFPSNQGYVPGRYCHTVADISCCIPCPSPEYLYPSDFYSRTRIPGYIAIASLVLSLYVLLCYAVLPAKDTRRGHLSVCMVLSIVLLVLGFVVPNIAKPQQCANEITPKDMYDSMECAWSGALIIAGGCSINMWILARTFSMYLQICWDVVPKKVFFWLSQFVAWGVSIILTAICLAVTGVSFRFGDYCHVNHYKSIGSIWGPLLGIASVTLILQLLTIAYCIRVYFRTLRINRNSSISTTSSVNRRFQAAREASRRIQKVFLLQWRSSLITVILLVDVIYFIIVFLVLDTETSTALSDRSKFMPWVKCMMEKALEQKGNPANECLPLVTFVPNGDMLIGTIGLLAVSGIEATFLLGTPKMITGWWDMFKRWRGDPEFISQDAARGSRILNSYEMSNVSSRQDGATIEKEPLVLHTPPITEIKTPENAFFSAGFRSPNDRTLQDDEIDPVTETGRRYSPHTNSFSSPRASFPRPRHPEWDYRLSFASPISRAQNSAFYPIGEYDERYRSP